MSPLAAIDLEARPTNRHVHTLQSIDSTQAVWLIEAGQKTPAAHHTDEIVAGRLAARSRFRKALS